MTALESLGYHGNSILYTNTATVLVLVYEYVPYMILCLYSSMEGIGDNLVHASHILGANRAKTFINVVFPMSVPACCRDPAGIRPGGRNFRGTKPGGRFQRNDGGLYDQYPI